METTQSLCWIALHAAPALTDVQRARIYEALAMRPWSYVCELDTLTRGQLNSLLRYPVARAARVLHAAAHRPGAPRLNVELAS